MLIFNGRRLKGKTIADTLSDMMRINNWRDNIEKKCVTDVLHNCKRSIW